MKNKKSVIGLIVLIALLSIFVLASIYFIAKYIKANSIYSKNSNYREIEKIAHIKALAYIEDKYGFEPTVTGFDVATDASNTIADLFGETPTGDATVHMEYEGVKFNVHLTAKETGRTYSILEPVDNYQKDEIYNAVSDYYNNISDNNIYKLKLDYGSFGEFCIAYYFDGDVEKFLKIVDPVVELRYDNVENFKEEFNLTNKQVSDDTLIINLTSKDDDYIYYTNPFYIVRTYKNNILYASPCIKQAYIYEDGETTYYEIEKHSFEDLDYYFMSSSDSLNVYKISKDDFNKEESIVKNIKYTAIDDGYCFEGTVTDDFVVFIPIAKFDFSNGNTIFVKEIKSYEFPYYNAKNKFINNEYYALHISPGEYVGENAIRIINCHSEYIGS